MALSPHGRSEEVQGQQPHENTVPMTALSHWRYFSSPFSCTTAKSGAKGLVIQVLLPEEAASTHRGGEAPAQRDCGTSLHTTTETLDIAHFPPPLLADPFVRQRYVHVLGQRKLYHNVQYTGGAEELDFFVEGLRFPDDTFSGLVSIHVSLLGTVTEVWGLQGRGADGRLKQPKGHGEGD